MPNHPSEYQLSRLLPLYLIRGNLSSRTLSCSSVSLFLSRLERLEEAMNLREPQYSSWIAPMMISDLPPLARPPLPSRQIQLCSHVLKPSIPQLQSSTSILNFNLGNVFPRHNHQAHKPPNHIHLDIFRCSPSALQFRSRGLDC